jgi:hypothetical protein
VENERFISLVEQKLSVGRAVYVDRIEHIFRCEYCATRIRAGRYPFCSDRLLGCDYWLLSMGSERTRMSDLHLAVKRVYFDNIKAGCKGEEYRLVNDYWKKRLIGRDYDDVVITLGYPSAGDMDRTLRFRYRGYEKRKLTHPHFGPDEVEVFAISLEEPID